MVLVGLWWADMVIESLAARTHHTLLEALLVVYAMILRDAVVASECGGSILNV